MAELKQYVLFDKNVPEWVNEQSKLGRIKLLFDEDGNPIGAVVHSPSKSETIGVGDAIILTKSGLSIKRSVAKERSVKDANQRTKIYKPSKSEGVQQKLDE